MRSPDVRHPTAIPLQFLALLGFWLLLSGRTDPLFVAMGVMAAAVSTALTLDMTTGVMHPAAIPVRRLPRCAWNAVAYLGWLITRIVAASVQIAVVVLSPTMPIEPTSARVRVGLKSPIARTIAANTITLIPGTVTIDVEDDVFTFHMFSPRAGADVLNGTLFRRVGAIFLEEPGTPVVIEAPEEGTEEAPG